MVIWIYYSGIIERYLLREYWRCSKSCILFSATQYYFDFGSGYWNFHNPTFFDIDNDDDFDCFVGTTNSHFMFFENTGTPGVAIWNLVTELFFRI